MDLHDAGNGERRSETLGEEVEDVRASDRLATSAACLVAPEHGPDRRLERILAMGGQGMKVSKPVLEINAGHPLVTALARRFAQPEARALVAVAAWLLLDEARLRDGEQPADAAAFAERLTRVMTRALG